MIDHLGFHMGSLNVWGSSFDDSWIQMIMHMLVNLLACSRQVIECPANLPEHARHLVRCVLPLVQPLTLFRHLGNLCVENFVLGLHHLLMGCIETGRRGRDIRWWTRGALASWRTRRALRA